MCIRDRPAGVLSVTGDFGADEAVEIAGPDGAVFAKGLVRHSAGVVAEWAGRQSGELPACLLYTSRCV